MVRAPFGASDMVLIDVIAGFAAGAFIAECARAPLSATYDPVRTRYFAVVLLLASGAFMPAGLVLYAQYPDWSLMYLANPAHLPQLLMVPVVLAACLLAPAGGFLLAHRFLQKGDDLGLRRTLYGALGALGVVVILGWSRITTVAYYDDFHHSGRLIGLHEASLLYGLLVIVFFVVFAFVYAVLQVRRHVEAIDTADPALSARPDAPLDDVTAS